MWLFKERCQESWNVLCAYFRIIYWNLIVFSNPTVLDWLDVCKFNPNKKSFKAFWKVAQQP